MSAVLYALLVLAVGAQRLGEMALSRRNAAWAFARGGVETGRAHFPAMVVLHTGLLLGCLAEVWLAGRPFVPALGWPMLALVVACQGVRWWCVAALGPRWNTRVIVVPGTAPVRTGPYRWLAHPNYAVVVVEGVALPLVHTAWVTALVFTVANAALLTVRLRVERRALRAAVPA
ncbi:isoprenylcysteine carboxyl methyltransferase family protein [Actinomycetospora straminea]|uniref:Isoprenylcysteine carboxyl methyltransferase family protein n=1 Tax=Actinomycetospora straminea TaxID=663607 RepID=A0ABP9F596_9PSEU|nr:isoprenylcysteine carboxyl methyltransferase family protein [Actinomycetospora straminea]MDD7936192.1 isoprenylcysteine carboxyl methyltransferase family protein [Actinomycetospora straminea]